MEKQISSIIDNLTEIMKGQPWHGKSADEILAEISPEKTNVRPGHHPHTAVDLIYHMLTWSEFTLKRIQGEQINDMKAFEQLDWREIDPQIHGWEEAVNDFKKTNDQIIEALREKNDDWLNNKVDYREYNFAFLLDGLIKHHIYHLAQINYIAKTLG